MSSTVFCLLFVCLSVATCIPSLWASWAWSGRDYSGARFRLTVIYMFFFGYLHLRFAYEGELPFAAPDLGPEPLLRPISFIFALIHLSCWPEERERRKWLFGEKSSNHITFSETRSTRSETAADRFFYLLKILFLSALLLFICSAITSWAVGSLIEIFTPLTHSARLGVWAVTGVIMVPLMIFIVRSSHKDGKRF